MRALLPRPSSDVDLVEAYATPPAIPSGRPFVRCNMVAALDGAITVNGRSGGLGGPGDRLVFQVLRAVADVVLVGAGTARAEHYSPVRLDDAAREQRLARRQSPVPPIAVVTGSGALDWSAPFFTDAEARPIVITTREGEAEVQRGASGLAEVVVAGDVRVDMAVALEALGAGGHRNVLLEGGPGLNADVIRSGLLDELCLTVSPHLVGGDGPRVLAGPALDPPLHLALVHVLEEDGLLFLRLAVEKGG